MPSITFDEFSVGLDRRQARSVADANRLWVGDNVYVTTGKTIRGRGGLVKVADLEPGTVGLRAGLGKLNTFYGGNAAIAHPDPMFAARRVSHPTLTQGAARVPYCDVFSGYLYAAVEFANGSIHHFYLDDPGAWAAATAYPLNTIRRPTTANGFRYRATAISGSGTSGGAEPTWPLVMGATVVDNAGANRITWTCIGYAVDDANCPNSASVVKQQQSLWAIGGEVVRFCATDAPRDWTTASDAGFLATGLQQSGATEALAVSEFDGKLAVFFEDAAQIWLTDPDPAEVSLVQQLYNSGTRYPRSPAQLGTDLVYLSDAGFRSIAVGSMYEKLQELDMGSPIDALVQPTLPPGAGMQPIGIYYSRGQQLWCLIGNVAWVFAYSKVSKISAWSRFRFPFVFDDAAVLGNRLYLRAGDTVYRYDEDAVTDDGQAIDKVAELAYLDFKAPGILKQIIGVDAVLAGAATVALRYDPNDEAKITSGVTLSDDTEPGAMQPVEICAVKVAPVVTHALPERFELHALRFYYENLGPV